MDDMKHCVCYSVHSTGYQCWITEDYSILECTIVLHTYEEGGAVWLLPEEACAQRNATK